jgi:hypothetical protein
VPIVFKLVIESGAKLDLAGIWDTDPDSAGVLYATLQQIAADQRFLDSLTIKDFGAHRTELVHVDQWVEQQRLGRNLWRLKHWDLEGKGQRYRVVYALDPRVSCYYVFGIFTRDFDYDATDARTERVIAAYDKLGIPAFR